MKVITIVGSITIALLLCSNAQGLTQAQIKQGCVNKGNTISCPKQMRRVEVAPIKRVEVAPMKRTGVAPMKRVEVGGMKRVEVGGMKRVEVGGMKRVEVGGMKRVEVGGMKRVEVAPMKRVEAGGITRYPLAPKAQESNASPQNGQGLNQAQIDAMEQQRRLLWNAGGGGMVYR
jgi:hypothetical protein